MLIAQKHSSGHAQTHVSTNEKYVMKREKTWMCHSLSRAKARYINGSNAEPMLSVLRTFELCSCGVILLRHFYSIWAYSSWTWILTKDFVDDFHAHFFLQVSINITVEFNIDNTQNYPKILNKTRISKKINKSLNRTRERKISLLKINQKGVGTSADHSKKS